MQYVVEVGGSVVTATRIYQLEDTGTIEIIQNASWPGALRLREKHYITYKPGGCFN